MTSSAVALSSSALDVDLRSGSTATWGTNARRTEGSMMVMLTSRSMVN